ncbi:MAG: glycoside hydrolase family 5 protein [Actinomycetota bacterium]|nr:glycoside hydrolase family 5 protein [Actinomycetota bacterium]
MEEVRPRWTFKGLWIALSLTVLFVLPIYPHSRRTISYQEASYNPVTLPLSVSGNKLIDSNGHVVRLTGVDKSGTEYACVQGWGIFDGPADQTTIDAMKSWGINAVRIPLNEDCWLSLNGVNPAYSGTNYQNAIGAFVNLLNQNGMVAILDLHWNAPGTQLATGQQQMADADHSVTFWSQVAQYFVQSKGVIFDLYNEPHDISWQCWRDGCLTLGGWMAAGMSQLLSAVRQAGSSAIVLMNGLDWGGDLSSWSSYVPADPLHKVVAGFHVYNFSGCNTVNCWQSTVGTVAAQVPVITGEVGANDCSSFPVSYMDWADQQGISYLAWTWDTWGSSCSSIALIASANGAPTQYGQAVETHIESLYSVSNSSPTTTTTVVVSQPSPVTTLTAPTTSTVATTVQPPGPHKVQEASTTSTTNHSAPVPTTLVPVAKLQSVTSVLLPSDAILIHTHQQRPNTELESVPSIKNSTVNSNLSANALALLATALSFMVILFVLRRMNSEMFY